MILFFPIQNLETGLETKSGGKKLLRVREFSLDGSERNGGHVFEAENEDVLEFVNVGSDFIIPNSLVILLLFLGLGQMDNLTSLGFTHWIFALCFKNNLSKQIW